MSGKTNDGGPAFPHPQQAYPELALRGMSLRDYFAGQAMAGMLAYTGAMSEAKAKDTAREAYWLADAMLAARAPLPHR